MIDRLMLFEGLKINTHTVINIVAGKSFNKQNGSSPLSISFVREEMLELLQPEAVKMAKLKK